MGKKLLQVILGEVDRELGDECRAAPVGPGATWVDRCNIAEASRGMIAREGVTVALVQIGVVVAQIKRELLPGKRYADVPSGVAFVGDAVRESGEEPIEAIAGS